MSNINVTHLRERGFRLTPQRRAILRILYNDKGHLSPAEVFQKVQQAMPGITEATVYRTLTFLGEQGLIMPTHIGNGHYVYEYAEHNHHHLICRGCGHTLEIDQQALDALSQQLEMQTGYQISVTHLTFMGLCPTCQGGKSI